MKRMRPLIILVLLIIALALQVVITQAYPVTGWSPIYAGIEYATGTATSPRLMRAFALRVDLTNPLVGVYASHDNGGNPYEVALQTTPAFLSDHGMKAAVNSCYFNASLSPNTNIEGLLVSNGTVVSTWQAARDAEIRFTSAKVASIVNNGGTSGVYTGCAGDAYHLINGSPGGDNGAAEPRTSAGLSQDGRYVILVCVDGRQSGWSDGATIYDMSLWQQSFGAYNAMNFDGGGSTTMSIAGMGSYVNRPCYGYARSVGASLGASSSNIINPPYLFTSGGDGWGVLNGVTGFTWTDLYGWPGVVFFDQVASDASIYNPSAMFAGKWANELFNVDVYAQNGNTSAHDMQLFWKNEAESTWDASRGSTLETYTAQNSWATVNLSANNSKWWGHTISQVRIDFDNTNHSNRWLVNHIVKQNALWWHFTSDVMGWTAGNGLTAPWWYDVGWPGILVTDQVGNDASIIGPAIPINGDYPFNYLGGVNDKIHVRVYPQNGSTTSHDMQVFWATTDDGNWTEGKSVAVNYTGKDQWVDVYFNVGANANWARKHITRLRLDFDGINHGNRWIVDYIATEY